MKNNFLSYILCTAIALLIGYYAMQCLGKIVQSNIDITSSRIVNAGR